MKNKFLRLVLSMVMCFSFINNVYADDLEFTVNATVADGNNTVVKGSEVIINVNVKSELHISACTFKTTNEDGIEFVSSTATAGYNVQEGSDGLKISDGSVTETSPTNTTLLQLRYKVNNNGKVTIKTLDCTSPTDNKTGSHEDVVVDLKTIDPTEDTTLSKLEISGGTLSPSFSSSVKNYSVQLDSTNFSLSLTTSNTDYQDDIVVTDEDGNTLDYSKLTFKNTNGQGNMPITIKINNDTTYKLLVVYKEESLNNSLKTLTVGGENVNIVDGKYEYTVTIGKYATNVKIEASLEDSKNFKFIEEFNGTQIVQTPSNSTSYPIIIEPSSTQVGADGVTYIIKLVKENTGNVNNETNNNTNNNNNNNQNTTTNPTTGGISIFVMFFILIISLITSIVIYQKKLEN